MILQKSVSNNVENSLFWGGGGGGGEFDAFFFKIIE